jgi:hypothetical protein
MSTLDESEYSRLEHACEPRLLQTTRAATAPAWAAPRAGRRRRRRCCRSWSRNLATAAPSRRWCRCGPAWRPWSPSCWACRPSRRRTRSCASQHPQCCAAISLNAVLQILPQETSAQTVRCPVCRAALHCRRITGLGFSAVACAGAVLYLLCFAVSSALSSAQCAAEPCLNLTNPKCRRKLAELEDQVSRASAGRARHAAGTNCGCCTLLLHRCAAGVQRCHHAVHADSHSPGRMAPWRLAIPSRIAKCCVLYCAGIPFPSTCDRGICDLPCFEGGLSLAGMDMAFLKKPRKRRCAPSSRSGVVGRQF